MASMFIVAGRLISSARDFPAMCIGDLRKNSSSIDLAQVLRRKRFDLIDMREYFASLLRRHGD